MVYVIDQQKRLRLPDFKPGDTWSPSKQDDNHILLVRLVPPPEPPQPRLERDAEGVFVVRGGPRTTLADTRKAMEEFP